VEDLTALTAEAFVYGYPLVCDLQAAAQFVHEGIGALPAAPFNVFAHATKLGGPGDKFVSVNNDTLYSIAQVDLSGGPIRLDVPDTAGAYYVLQFVDAWTNNFAYIGRRATGTGEGRFLLVPPDHAGETPPDRATIRSPTTVATIVGRFACEGGRDVGRVRALQSRLTLIPLHPEAALAGIPRPDPQVGDDLRFLENLRGWIAAFPPAEADRAYQQRFAPLGLLQIDDSPYADPDPDQGAALASGISAGKDQLDELTRSGQGRQANGWDMNLHMFDYNLDHFEIGAIDGPQWKMADRTACYTARAVAARVGLWGNHAYEAAYPMVHVDGDGERLTGARSYTLRFDELPPVDAFWSLTMYDTPDYFLVDNPIDRYSVGDRTPGLSYGPDGSLTIAIHHEQPTNEVELANWLPAPEGEFRPVLRLYQPRAAVLDGSYQIPPIRPRA